MSGSNTKIGGGGFHHVSIKTAKWDETMAFFQEGLGFVPKISWRDAPRRAAMLDTGDGNYLEVFEDLAFSPQTDGSIGHFALRTDDCAAALERARAAGGMITMELRDLTIPSDPPTPIRIGFCEAPGGVVIEFFQNELT